MEKKVPLNKNCGSVIRFANGGMVLSLFAKPLMMKPKPIKINNPKKLKKSISKTVIHPLTNVKPKNKYPAPIITMAVII